jgi:hypothetical protein
VKKLLLLIAVLLVAAAGWRVYATQKDKTPATNTTNQTTQATQQELYEKDPSLRKYHDTELNFSFFYPKVWGEIRERADSSTTERRVYSFSNLPGASIRVNALNISMAPVEFSDWSINVKQVVKDGSSVVVKYAGKDETAASSEQVLNKNAPCIFKEIHLKDINSLSDENAYLYQGYCGLSDPKYGAFIFNSNNVDTSSEEGAKLKGQIQQLLVTFQNS